MSESYDPPAVSGQRKKGKFLVPVFSGTAVLLLIAGTAVGIQASNAETSKRCADATAVARSTNDALAASEGKAAKVLAVVQGAKGYAKADGAATLLSGFDKASQDLDTGTLSTECATRDQAATLLSDTATAATKSKTLEEVAVKLGDHVTAFQAAETKRIDAEKKAAAAVAQAEAEREAAARPVPQYVAPQPVGSSHVPAPAPYFPAPAPVGGGGSSGAGNHGGGIPNPGGGVVGGGGIPNGVCWTSNGMGGLKPC